jgi:hypothetical protein
MISLIRRFYFPWQYCMLASERKRSKAIFRFRGEDDECLDLVVIGLIAGWFSGAIVRGGG